MSSAESFKPPTLILTNSRPIESAKHLAKVVLQMPSIQQFDNKDVLDSLDRSLKEQMKKLVNC